MFERQTYMYRRVSRGQNHCFVRACATGMCVTGTYQTTAFTHNPIEKFDPQAAAWRHMHKVYTLHNASTKKFHFSIVVTP